MASLVTLNIEREDIFYDPSKISSFVLDSLVPSLASSITKSVSASSKYLPDFLVKWTLILMDGNITKRAKFSIFDIEAKRFIKDVLVPCYFIIGQQDNHIDVGEFNKMFIECNMLKAL